jgi:hypothetical protein
VAHGKGWDTYLPRTYWNTQAYSAIADGVGLVTFAHTETPAEAIVYEFEGSWSRDSKPEQLVTYHCTACTAIGDENSACRPNNNWAPETCGAPRATPCRIPTTVMRHPGTLLAYPRTTCRRPPARLPRLTSAPLTAHRPVAPTTGGHRR